jgi:apolipoprotein N-acyltransferase
MSAFSRGSADQPSLLIPVGEQTVVLSPAICYEIAYPEFVSRRARETGVLVTVSNDTWFGTTFGPEQHLQIARMRALETGRWVLRATNDGYTAFINPQGQVVRQAPRFEATWLSHEVEARQGSTPRMVTGPWPPLLLGLLPVCAALLLRRRQQPVRSRY